MLPHLNADCKKQVIMKKYTVFTLMHKQFHSGTMNLGVSFDSKLVYEDIKHLISTLALKLVYQSG